MAGSVAPIRSVGGSRQMPAVRPRSRMPAIPGPPNDVDALLRSGIPKSTSTPIAPMPASRSAYIRSGCRKRAAASRGSSRLPRHIPPMNVPSSTPIDTAEDPMTS